jgi:hypothetical protein
MIDSDLQEVYFSINEDHVTTWEPKAEIIEHLIKYEHLEDREGKQIVHMEGVPVVFERILGVWMYYP